jgi:hypothetical protein
MKSAFPITAAALLAIAPPPASATSTPIKVTRFHLNQPIVPGTVSVEIAPDAAVVPGPEAQLYVDAVAHALSEAGFTPQPAATPGDYHVVVSISRDIADLPPAPKPLQVGLGGEGGNRGFGLGGSVSFGVGKQQPRALVTTRISIRIMRATAPDIIWEGRATQAIEERGKYVQPAATADKLAHALFKGFPGESGRTISVR